MALIGITDSSEFFVETDRGRVPIQNLKVDSLVSARLCKPCDFLQHRFADCFPAIIGGDKNVFEIKTNFTVKMGTRSVGLTIAKNPEPRVGDNQNTIELTLTCDTQLAPPLSAKQVRDAVVAPLPASVQALLKNAPLGKDNRNLHVSGAKTCIKP